MTTAHSETKGGVMGHVVRRFIHLGIILIPFVYYDWILPAFSIFHAHLLILIIMFIVTMAELIRLHCRFVFFAQRAYEATHFSSFAWTLLSSGVVLLFSPAQSFSIAILVSCALIDPLLGELKPKLGKTIVLFLIGVVAVTFIWIMCALHNEIPLWLAFVMGPITIAAEWPTFRWIDDNALMILVPLAVVVLVI